jgi:hypothetical protein
MSTMERSGIKHYSNYILHSLKEIVKNISDTAVETNDITSAFGKVMISD